ncbi:tripartite tricarboxylate transporter substrate-binding protein [Mesorhizobium neociceri]|uniref:Tripartite tricarboxylate transporter substrate binding protein n=1 Tax=Mesorhizobium neociceri TaxID=1307853 RepID=A0A838BAK9_9HYPH|nr:tripartite tricarboxylate transporter substrate-binding protein [Mesorhizobium neociceri]MBA1143242.1 tripartite tricarboxylate transporter substrate binding protein [Mesorhizobium neociceri]
MKSTANLAASTRVYPAKPVRIIDPFGAGGGPDLLARALAPKLSALWGQPVTVENIPGAGATAGPAQVAKSPADGYTLLINTNAQAYGAALLKDLPYDPLKDFIPIVPLTRQAYALVAGRATGVTTVGELIAAAKAKPGELKFGSTGIGTGTHVGVEKFNQAAGIKALHVPSSPNDSNADTIANAIARRFTYYLVPISLALPHIRDGTLVALGVSTATRSTLLPEVPTIAEASVASFDFPIWYGMWAPAGSPTGVVETLANDIGRVLTEPDLREWIAGHGGEPMSMTQPEFVRFVQSESEGAARLMKAASAKP